MLTERTTSYRVRRTGVRMGSEQKVSIIYREHSHELMLYARRLEGATRHILYHTQSTVNRSRELQGSADIQAQVSTRRREHSAYTRPDRTVATGPRCALHRSPLAPKIKSTARRAPHDGATAGDLCLRDRVRHRLVHLDANLRLRLGVIVGR